MSFTGGKLKLKGGDVGKKKGKRKKAKEGGEGGEGALIVVEGAAGGAAVVQEVSLMRHWMYPELMEVAALLRALTLRTERQGMRTCYQPRPPLTSWTGLFPGTSWCPEWVVGGAEGEAPPVCAGVSSSKACFPHSMMGRMSAPLLVQETVH